jgi:hypothetical protein
MDLGGVRDITVRAGEDFSIHVSYVGFPKPSASWFSNDNILEDSDSRVFMQVCTELKFTENNLNYFVAFLSLPMTLQA